MASPDKAGRVIRGLVDEAALAKKMATDPRIRQVIAKNMAGLDPALAARVKAGDPQATLEAYQAIAAGGGRLPPRQMELPLNAAPPGESPRGLVPYGVRGPGVPVGGPSGPGVAGGLSGPGARQGQMIPSRNQPPANVSERGLAADYEPDVNQMGISEGSWTDEMPGGAYDPTGLSTDVDLPGIEYDGVLRGERIPRQPGKQYRGQGASGPAINRRGNGFGRAAAAAGGTLAGGLGIDLFFGRPGEEDSPGDVTSTSGTADLHSEQAPPPSVTTPREPTAEDYFAQARALINQLNQMRRAAGGEVPESRAMMAQIQRLQDIGNRMRNSPSYMPADPSDPAGQAQMLIQQLNAMRERAGGEVPQAPRILAEVRRLQAEADAQNNRTPMARGA